MSPGSTGFGGACRVQSKAGVKRLLFVDDDRAVLDAMRNLLRRHRNEWDMQFFSGASEAMHALEGRGCDVIITDMKMPVTDGTALLEVVKQRFPGTVRIVLSGQSEEGQVLKSLGVAHQFLAKPFTSSALVQVIERSCGLSNDLGEDPLRDLIGRLDALPAVPSIYLELTAAVSRPNACAAALAAIVEKDPAMSAKVLQLVNSAFFGLTQPVGGIAQAVAYLGTEMLKGVALCAHVFQNGGTRAKRLSLERVQESSVAVARTARQILTRTADAELAFTAGLVHRVGQLALAAGFDGYDDVLAEAEASGRPVTAVEAERLGATHAQVGGHLLCIWGLPKVIVDAVAHQVAPPPAKAMDVGLALHAAIALVEGKTPDVPRPDGQPWETRA